MDTETPKTARKAARKAIYDYLRDEMGVVFDKTHQKGLSVLIKQYGNLVHQEAMRKNRGAPNSRRRPNRKRKHLNPGGVVKTQGNPGNVKSTIEATRPEINSEPQWKGKKEPPKSFLGDY